MGLLSQNRGFTGFINKTGFNLLTSIIILSHIVTTPAHAQELAMQEPIQLKGSVQIDASGQRLLIDTETHVIGGATDRSSASGSYRQLPAQKFPFMLSARSASEDVTLTIGSIRGLNTPEAHAAGQSKAGFVSSPAVIKVNGVRVGYIYEDGESVRIQVPKTALRTDGFNMLQIEAGFYFLPGNRIAYDELELQHLALVY